jgi:mannose-1-phosphate guanylyltransferase
MNNVNRELISSFADLSIPAFSNNSVEQDRWAVILAGGDGSRLLSLTRKITGDERPKQFCSFLGTGTLLDETRRRVELGFPASNILFVLTEKHERYYNNHLRGVPPRNLVVQPKNIGTAPAILYSLLRLEKSSPQASAAFFPSDHYFSDNKIFMSYVEIAFDAVRLRPDSVVLLGIKPEGPDEEYGWIEPEKNATSGTTQNLWNVRRFWEKPAPALAQELFSRGCLWNSFVMVGQISAVLKMIRKSAAELFREFDRVKSKISTFEEEAAIRSLYDSLPESNFSKEVLTVRAKDLTVIPVIGSKWSDLGSPRRVMSALSELGAIVPMPQKQVINNSFPGGNT